MTLLIEGWIWGMDIDSKQAAIACINAETGAYQTNAVRWRKDRPRKSEVMSQERSLAACRLAIRRFVPIMAKHFPPAACAYELPIGTYPKPMMLMHAGVIVENTLDLLNLAPFQYSSTHWKARVGLKGNANKEAVAEWARNHGAARYSDDQNQFDALGVATAAYLELVEGSGQHLLFTEHAP